MSKDPALDKIAAVVRGIANAMPGWPGGTTDLADLRIVLETGGAAAFGVGEAEGADRATKAAEAALADFRLHLRCLVQR